jgi:hypothetical protein
MLVLAFTGCIHVPIQHGVTENYYRNRDTADTSEVIIYREMQYVGGAALLQVLVDSVSLAGLYTGEYIRFTMTPGQHIISAKHFSGVSSYMPVIITAGANKYVILSMTWAGDLNFLEVDKAEMDNVIKGRTELK